MHLFYNLFTVILVILALPLFFLRLIREEGFGERLKQSCGFLPADTIAKVAGKDCIWLHAASVGEIVATSPITKELHRQLPDVPILISVVTATGYAMAHRIIPEANAIIFFPVDLPWLGYRVINRIRPCLFLLVETELWPNFLRAIKAHNIPVMMVNGRISDKSSRRYHYLGTILKDMLGTVSRFCMQASLDAQYIIKLGADARRVVVTGNTKFDQVYAAVSDQDRAELARELGLTGHGPLIVAGSTHKGEEEIVFQAFQALRRRFPDARLIIAPRSLLRVDEIINLAKEFRLKCFRRTALAQGAAGGNGADLVLLDTIGELGRVYSLGDVVFVGGSLIPQGGHNILEPAAHGKAIIVGPHMFNFKDTYALLSRRGACITVQNARELAREMVRILEDETVRSEMNRAALAIIRENGGAAAKTVAYIKECLSESRLSAGANSRQEA